MGVWNLEGVKRKGIVKVTVGVCWESEGHAGSGVLQLCGCWRSQLCVESRVPVVSVVY